MSVTPIIPYSFILKHPPIMGLLGIGSILVAGFMISDSWERIGDYQQLDARGIWTKGAIVRCTYGKYPEAFYDFSVRGKLYHSSEGIMTNDLEIGDPVRVQYLPDRPGVNRSPASGSYRQYYAFICFGAFLIGCGGLMIGYAIKSAKPGPEADHAA